MCVLHALRMVVVLLAIRIYTQNTNMCIRSLSNINVLRRLLPNYTLPPAIPTRRMESRASGRISRDILLPLLSTPRYEFPAEIYAKWGEDGQLKYGMVGGCNLKEKRVP